MKQDRVLSLIGLATKAGKCASGEFMTENETKSGKDVYKRQGRKSTCMMTRHWRNTEKRMTADLRFRDTKVLEKWMRISFGKRR